MYDKNEIEDNNNMTNDFDSQPDVPQSDKVPVSETGTTPSLEVVVDFQASQAPAANSFGPSLKLITLAAVSEPAHRSIDSPQHYFTAEIRRRSPHDFIMVARDSFHYLYCELPLSFEEGENGLSLICQFPTICDDELVGFIEENEDLLGMALISFHMQILKNLFLFCAAHKVQNLILQATEVQFEGLGIYQDFIKYVDKIPTTEGALLEITVPFSVSSLIKWEALMENIIQKFRKTLWQDQSSVPTIRNYLKANVRLSIIT
jgi:hypothetical protein